MPEAEKAFQFRGPLLFSRTFRSRLFVELFDFANSLIVVPAIEKQDVAIPDRSYQGIVILRPIALIRCQ
jgi:hypothetical protein